MKEKIVIYSAIFGGKDQISDDQPPGYEYVLFTDRPAKTKLWDVRLVKHFDFRIDDKRKVRFFKLLPHRHFIDHQFSIWIDGNMRLKIGPDVLVENFLNRIGHFHAQQEYDVEKYAPKGAVHSNLYHEASLCIKLGKDDPQVIIKQIEAYRHCGCPNNSGLWMGGVIVRKHHHPCSILIGESWYKQIIKYSCRDQISLPYILWRHELDINTIPFYLKLADRDPHLY